MRFEHRTIRSDKNVKICNVTTYDKRKKSFEIDGYADSNDE